MSRAAVLIGIALIALGIAVLLSPQASERPDGLERVAEDLGFAKDAGEGEAPMAGYEIAVAGGGGRSRALAGASGTLIALGAGLLLGRFLIRRRGAPAERDGI